MRDLFPDRWPGQRAKPCGGAYGVAGARPPGGGDGLLLPESTTFRTTGSALTGPDAKVARALADMATVALVSDRAVTAHQVLIDQPQADRSLIGGGGELTATWFRQQEGCHLTLWWHAPGRRRTSPRSSRWKRWVKEL